MSKVALHHSNGLSAFMALEWVSLYAVDNLATALWYSAYVLHDPCSDWLQLQNCKLLHKPESFIIVFCLQSLKFGFVPVKYDAMLENGMLHLRSMGNVSQWQRRLAFPYRKTIATVGDCAATVEKVEPWPTELGDIPDFGDVADYACFHMFSNCRRGRRLVAVIWKPAASYPEVFNARYEKIQGWPCPVARNFHQPQSLASRGFMGRIIDIEDQDCWSRSGGVTCIWESVSAHCWN